MLFNSHGFIWLFLPLVLLGYYCFGRFHYKFSAGWLAASSLFFYGYWNVYYVYLLLASIGANFVFGLGIISSGKDRKLHIQRYFLVLAICCNLLLLAYFKYYNFFIGNINAVTSYHLPLLDIVLPLGISFFTFTQIAFLVDAYKGKVRGYSLVHYLLFVTYFPHLIAGPIIHHQEMIPQFEKKSTYQFNYGNIAVGLTIFIIGLFKKVVLADSLALFVPPAFTFPDVSSGPGFVDAWGGVLAYAFQIYFDFSGYSDMAIGISRMFGIHLPLNFNSPYKSVSIIEFWRRWHMTLSRFLRDYLYIPLGGNKKGEIRRFVNIMITMLLGGAWHGASWTYVVWGTLHGIYLVINHLFKMIVERSSFSFFYGSFWRYTAHLLTFLCVLVGWVFFRADSLQDATKILESMLYMHGVGNTSLGLHSWLPWILISSMVVWILPNTQEFMCNHRPALDYNATLSEQKRHRIMIWRPSLYWAGFLFLFFFGCLIMMSQNSPFLYFQF